MIENALHFSKLLKQLVELFLSLIAFYLHEIARFSNTKPPFDKSENEATGARTDFSSQG